MNEEPEWLQREWLSYEESMVGKEDVLLGYQRLASIFNIDPSFIHADFVFGKDLQSSFNSLFRPAELDRVRHDLEDMDLILDPRDERTKDDITTAKGYVELIARARRCDDPRLKKLFVKITNKWLKK